MAEVFKLKVVFSNLEAGWLLLEIHYGLELLVIPISYIFNSPYCLVQALREKLDIEGLTIVRLLEEPQETNLYFQRTGQLITLVIYSFSNEDERQNLTVKNERLNISGSYEEICLPFWRAFRSLQGRYSPEEISRRWQKEFPIQELERLTSAIAEAKAKK